MPEWLQNPVVYWGLVIGAMFFGSIFFFLMSIISLNTQIGVTMRPAFFHKKVSKCQSNDNSSDANQAHQDQGGHVEHLTD